MTRTIIDISNCTAPMDQEDLELMKLFQNRDQGRKCDELLMVTDRKGKRAVIHKDDAAIIQKAAGEAIRAAAVCSAIILCSFGAGCLAMGKGSMTLWCWIIGGAAIGLSKVFARQTWY